MAKSLEAKAKAAYKHGGMDYWAGAPRNPETPLKVYRDLNEEEQAVIKKAWDDGWMNERNKCLNSLPDGMPA